MGSFLHDSSEGDSTIHEDLASDFITTSHHDGAVFCDFWSADRIKNRNNVRTTLHTVRRARSNNDVCDYKLLFECCVFVFWFEVSKEY